MTDQSEIVTGEVYFTEDDDVLSARGIALSPAQAESLSAPNGDLYKRALQIVEAEGAPEAAAFIAALTELARQSQTGRVSSTLIARFTAWAKGIGAIARAAGEIVDLIRGIF